MDSDFYKQLIQELPIGYAYHKVICDEDGIGLIEIRKAKKLLQRVLIGLIERVLVIVRLSFKKKMVHQCLCILHLVIYI